MKAANVKPPQPICDKIHQQQPGGGRKGVTCRTEGCKAFAFVLTSSAVAATHCLAVLPVHDAGAAPGRDTDSRVVADTIEQRQLGA